MSTVDTLGNNQTGVGNLRYERMFFSWIAAFVLVSVFIGFAQSYLQGAPRAQHWRALNTTPYPFVVHLHGVIFSAWILLTAALCFLFTFGQTRQVMEMTHEKTSSSPRKAFEQSWPVHQRCYKDRYGCS